METHIQQNVTFPLVYGGDIVWKQNGEKIHTQWTSETGLSSFSRKCTYTMILNVFVSPNPILQFYMLITESWFSDSFQVAWWLLVDTYCKVI